MAMTLDDFTSHDSVSDRLSEAGHPPSVARRLARRFGHAAEPIEDRATSREAVGFFVPGRIEVLGKHSDYAGGSSLTCATSRGFCMVAAPDPSNILTLVNADTGDVARIDLDAPVPASTSHWSTYPRTVVRRMTNDLRTIMPSASLVGGTVVFSSTLPQAAGMSSSSAMVVAFFMAFLAMSRGTDRSAYERYLSSRSALAAYLAAMESGRAFGPFSAEKGVGTEGGSEDHTAILCAAPDVLRRFSYDPVRLLETVPLSDRWRFVVGVSGVAAEKAGSAQAAYNSASRLATEATRRWNEQTGCTARHLGAVMREEGFSMARFRAVMRAASDDPEPLIQRAEHFYVENQVVLPAAMEALGKQDWTTFGELVEQSQVAAATLLGNQVPETNHLAESAQRLGAIAASSFGAGFGGAVWALVPKNDVDVFKPAWRNAYAARFPRRDESAYFFVERPGPAAFQL